jgi:hypothetical protein
LGEVAQPAVVGAAPAEPETDVLGAAMPLPGSGTPAQDAVAAAELTADPPDSSSTGGRNSGRCGASTTAPQQTPPVRRSGAVVPTVAAPQGDGIDAMLRRGNDALGAGSLEVALQVFSDAADQYNRAEAHVGVARTYLRMGREDLALVRFERATEVNARYQPAWLEYADLLRARGESAAAVAAYERVLAIRDTGTAADRARRALDDLRP